MKKSSKLGLISGQNVRNSLRMEKRPAKVEDNPYGIGSNAARGGQKGNKNAAKDAAKKGFLSARCLGEDKKAWLQAARAEKKAGLLILNGRSLLAAWVIKRLNEAAKIHAGRK